MIKWCSVFVIECLAPVYLCRLCFYLLAQVWTPLLPLHIGLESSFVGLGAPRLMVFFFLDFCVGHSCLVFSRVLDWHFFFVSLVSSSIASSDKLLAPMLPTIHFLRKKSKQKCVFLFWVFENQVKFSKDVSSIKYVN